MKNKSKLLSILTLAALFSPPTNSHLHAEDIDVSPKEPPKPKGLKKFIIDNKEVWAINEKNARRKAAKIAQ